MGREKRHHYVPSSYLERFTSTGLDSGPLWVFDAEACRTWKSTPTGSAHARDYNRIQVDGVDPLMVEKDIFCRIEDAGARLFSHLQSAASVSCSTGRLLVTPSDVEELAIYLAAQVIRVPARRRELDSLQSDVARTQAEVIAASPAAFASMKARHGVDDVTLDDLRSLLQDPSVRLTVTGDPTSHLATTLPALVALARVLTMRRWSLLVAPESSPPFITSDDPVVLVSERSGPHISVGFGTERTCVIFGVTRRLCLFGDDFQPHCAVRPLLPVLQASPQRVAALNLGILGYATRYLYSSEPDFTWLDIVDGSLRDGAAFLERAKVISAQRSRQ